MAFQHLLIVALLCGVCCSIALGKSEKPKHIIMIMTDDQGLSDVGYRDPQFKTPNIDKLFASGISLENYYAASDCSPSRASLLTGKYIQNLNFTDGASLTAATGELSLDVSILPGYLKNQGYRTVGVGKWHLGHSTVKQYPVSRGFDEWFGNLEGQVDYFTKTVGFPCANCQCPAEPTANDPNGTRYYGVNCNMINGFDITDGLRPDTEYLKDTTYYTELLGSKAVEKILNHDTAVPFFMYLATTAPHQPLQVTDKYLDRCANVTNPPYQTVANARTILCGMMAAVDDVLYNVTEALRSKNMLKDTIFFWQSDNGGVLKDGSVNGNFRYGKTNNFEGGVRVPAFISGEPIANLAGTVYTGLTQNPICLRQCCILAVFRIQ